MLFPPRRAPSQCVHCVLRQATAFASHLATRTHQLHGGSRRVNHTRIGRSLAAHTAKTSTDHNHRARAPSQHPRRNASVDYKTKVYRFAPDSDKRQVLTQVQIPRKQKKNAQLQIQLAELERGLEDNSTFSGLGLDLKTLQSHFGRFRRIIESQENAKDENSRRLHHQVHEFATQGFPRELELILRYGFYGFVAATRLGNNLKRDQRKLLNFSSPATWYPKAREIQREVHVHVGPTNSGKTYHALKRLQEADTGMYAGPLRLLAYEVYERLNALGKVCGLVTGDDRRIPDDATIPNMTSCTVEMISTARLVDVAVIDEIQLLGSEDRGWAWTEALLGVRAKEVHVCGEARTVPLLEELVAACGDKLHIHRYERLSPLEMMNKPIKDLHSLRKGDCIIAFSVVSLHGLRDAIERKTKKKCAIIYGSLPPEVRAQQAKLFNDPDNDYDFLVASNAIGMGINLKIKRLIFKSGGKTIAGKFTPLDVAEVKQIAGRAGRYSTADDDNKRSTNPSDDSSRAAPVIRTPAPGLVTTMDWNDYALVEQAMQSEPEPIASAGILPPAHVIEQFSRYFPAGTPFAYLLMQMKEFCRHHKRLHMCVMTSQLGIADSIESVKGLRVYDRLMFCMSPVETKRPELARLIRRYAQMVADVDSKSVEQIEDLELELLDGAVQPNREYLERLELLHRSLILFLWLSFKFCGIFLEREVALHAKRLVELRIDETLSLMAAGAVQTQRAVGETMVKTSHECPSTAGSVEPNNASLLATAIGGPAGRNGFEGGRIVNVT